MKTTLSLPTETNHECSACGPHAVKVREVLDAQDPEDILSLWENLRFRPHHTPDGRIALIDMSEQRELCSWTQDEAKEFLNEVLLPGPYGAELVLGAVGIFEVAFRHGELVALAAGLKANLVVLDSTYLANR